MPLTTARVKVGVVSASDCTLRVARRKETGPVKKCPFCAEEIQDEAVICRFCNRPQAPLGSTRRVALRLVSAGDRQEDVVAVLTRLTRRPESWAREIVAESFKGPVVVARDVAAMQAERVVEQIAAAGGRAEIASGGRSAASPTATFGSLSTPTRQGGGSAPAGPVLLGLGGAIMAIGSFLPWISVAAPFYGSLSENGLQGGGDGIATLIAGIVVLALAVVTYWNPSPAAGIALVVAILAGFLMAVDIPSISTRIHHVEAVSSFVSASVGAGVFTVLVGAVAAIVGGLVTMSAVRQAAQAGTSA